MVDEVVFFFFCFSLTVSPHQRSIVTFVFLPLLSEGQAVKPGDVHKPMPLLTSGTSGPKTPPCYFRGSERKCYANGAPNVSNRQNRNNM
jgi:hypothetical protein